MGQRKKAIYSEEFQAMLDKLEEEDYADRSSSGGSGWMRKSRLCIEQVKALEKHFEVENKLQPERKMKIAQELGLEPRQVAVWFQNRRARWKAKHLEREYDQLRASYDALNHDYASLQQERQALLSQLKDLKAKVEARNPNTTDHPLNSSEVSNKSTTSLNISLPTTSASSSCRTVFNPLIPTNSSSMDGHQLWRTYQNQMARMEESIGMFSNEESCNIFSVDQAPTLHWHHGDHFN